MDHNHSLDDVLIHHLPHFTSKFPIIHYTHENQPDADDDFNLVFGFYSRLLHHGAISLQLLNFSL